MIEVESVSKSFGRVAALTGVSLRIEKGERVALVGSNGSGKTTLLRAILGLVRCDGRIRVGGIDVAREPEVALRGVAYIPQIAPPLDAPVGELVRVVTRLRGLPAGEVEDRALRLGVKVQDHLTERFRDLSGGTKQKLLAALALAVRAPVLVCDEPTANLDAAARNAFFREVAERPAHSVLVLCSHRVDEVRHLVDRVIELGDGRVQRDGSLASLLAELRSFRVEIALRPGFAAARDALVAHGFRDLSQHRFGALLTQEEKLSVVSSLLAKHGDAIQDLSVYDAEDLATSPRAPATPPLLRVVS